ncbi:puromycin-sensitive aminopeptidase-like protein, partial [Ceratina calcarata]|uniref:Puromycin-sensitive aminopeptidase-like protein n=1 Tax=Ceratina calcarata TaxID=156304 RepID=A0AAJ7J794_9HYME
MTASLNIELRQCISRVVTWSNQFTGRYYRVNYDVENWELLMRELNKGNNTKIHVLNRAQMIDDALNLARIDSLKYTVALNVTLYLTHEADYMPWQPAFRHLSFLRNLLRTSEKYHTFMMNAFLLDKKLLEWLEKAIKHAATNMLWIKKYKSTVDKWLDDNSDQLQYKLGIGGACWIVNVASESKMTRTFVTFLLVLGVCQASFVLGNTDEDQVDLSYRLPSGVVIPTKYKLHFKPDVVKFTFEGEVDITLIALTTNNILTLNSKYLSIYNVKFVDLNTTKTLENEYLMDEEHEILNITIKPQFEKDHHYSLQIKYNGILNDKSKGFYRSQVIQRGQVVGYIATTYFEPTYARLAFPCWDEPAYKAKFDISLTHDKTLQAISNTDVLKKEEKDDMITTSFKETRLMSTYLVAFVVSNYEFKVDKDGNFTYRVWTRKTMIKHVDYALEMGRELLEELNLYMNISYQTYMPDKLDQIAEKDFPVGAMENWGFVIFREGTLLYDKALSTTRTKMRILMIIAHELIHQWFGDLVTPKWWKYIWLNEGFANYFQYFITHENKDVITPKQIDDLFDGIAYQKGNVDSNDLFGSLQKALDESGIKWNQPVQVVMHNWVECSGYPTLIVKRVDRGYELTQERFVIELMMKVKYPTKWWIPITYVEESNPDFNNTTPIDWFFPGGESHTVLSKEETGWFVFNTQQT